MNIDMNYTQTHTIRQEVSERNNNNFISSSLPVQSNDLKLTKAVKDVFTFLARRAHLRIKNFSHAYIAGLTGRSINTVKRCIKLLVLWGLISYVYRHRRTSLYTLTLAFFSHPFVKAITKNFEIFSLKMHLSSCWQKSHRDVPSITNYKNELPSIIFKDFIYKITVTKKDLDRRRGEWDTMKHQKTKDPEKEGLLVRLKNIIPLTEHGKLAVSRYTLPAIKEMIRCAPAAMKSTDPFRYLSSIATKFSERNNMPIDYAGYHLAREEAGLDKDHTDFISPIRLQISQSQSIPKKRESINQEASGTKPLFKLNPEDEKRIENQPLEILKTATMNIDLEQPGSYFMRIIQTGFRNGLTQQGHMLDCDQNEAKESMSKESRNGEKQGVCN